MTAILASLAAMAVAYGGWFLGGLVTETTGLSELDLLSRLLIVMLLLGVLDLMLNRLLGKEKPHG